jgi:glycosyltransferase involved in cell wall biosynthesis
MTDERPTGPSITGVLTTRDSAATVGSALESLASWVDELLVIDMASSDGTAEISEALGARVLQHPPIPFVEPARAFAVAQASGEWVFLLDPDEVVPWELAQTLVEVARSGTVDVVNIPTLNYMLGLAMLTGGWHPEQQRHRRFFRRSALEFHDQIHSQPTVRDGTRSLDLPYRTPDDAIAHFAYASIREFIERTNRYTSIEAEQTSRAATMGAPSLAAVAWREFRQRYFKREGRRDGWRGLAVAVLMIIYRWLSQMKSYEASQASEEHVQAFYAAEARRLVATHPKRSQQR